jgi:hypothetical protein
LGNKFYKKLKKIGFKKIPDDDGFVMYELTPSKLNQPKEKSIMKNKIYFALGFTFCAFGFSMILLGVLHNWSI